MHTGSLAEFLLTSWLYAFFCFDYKWSLRRQPLAARIAYFEAHWAFFGGFGAACTLPVRLSTMQTLVVLCM